MRTLQSEALDGKFLPIRGVDRVKTRHVSPKVLKFKDKRANG